MEDWLKEALTKSYEDLEELKIKIDEEVEKQKEPLVK